MPTSLLKQCVTARPVLLSNDYLAIWAGSGWVSRQHLLSQCRCLTVVSAQNNILHSAEWDLNLIDEKDDWLISVLDDEEIGKLPFVEMLGKERNINTLERLGSTS